MSSILNLIVAKALREANSTLSQVLLGPGLFFLADPLAIVVLDIEASILVETNCHAKLTAATDVFCCNQCASAER